MTEVVTTGIITTGQARDSLAEIADGFDAGRGEPVYFGSDQSHAQAVIVPVDVWEGLLEAAEDEVDQRLAEKRLAEAGEARLSMDDAKALFDQARRDAGELPG